MMCLNLLLQWRSFSKTCVWIVGTLLLLYCNLLEHAKIVSLVTPVYSHFYFKLVSLFPTGLYQ